MLVSPLVNDAIRMAGLDGATFLAEFACETAMNDSWSSTRRGGWALDGASLLARRNGDDIEAEAYLIDGLHVGQTADGGVLRVPLKFPATFDLALVGRPLTQIVEHRLIARPGYLIEDVVHAAAGGSRLVHFRVTTEPLIK